MPEDTANSVKAVVDAYHGHVRLYVSDERDPRQVVARINREAEIWQEAEIWLQLTLWSQRGSQVMPGLSRG